MLEGGVKTTELVILGIFLVSMLFIGVYFSRRALSSEHEYWVASRFLGQTFGGFAVFAVVGSASTMLGIVGLTYNLGVPFGAAVAVSFTLQFPLVAYLTARPLLDKNLCTLGDYFKEYVGGKHIQALYAILTIIFMSAYVIPQLKASGIVGQWLLGTNYETMVVIIGLTFLIYASIGGMWAVTYSDILQGILMFAGAVVLSFTAIVGFGGMGDLLTQSIAIRPQLTQMGMPLISVVGLASTWALWGLVAPMTVMRVLTMRNARSARRSMMLGSILAGLSVGFVALVLAMSASIIAPEGLQNADMAFVVVMNHFFPPVMRGIMVIAIFAAIMSSTDSFLLSVSATVARDIYKGLINPQTTEKQVIRIAVVTLWIAGIITIIISMYTIQLISILTAWAAGGLISCLLSPLLMGFYWKGTTRDGVFAGMLTGFLAFGILKYFVLVPNLSEMLVAIPLSALATYITSTQTESYFNKQTPGV